MNKTYSYIICAAYLVCLTTTASADDTDTHSAYKVTSYNLGAILSFQDDSTTRARRNYQPLLITSTASDILNSEHNNTVSWVEPDTHTGNSNGIALAAKYDASRKISVLGAFGVTRNLWTPDNIDYENESSWEANLGIIYKLLDNLSIEMHFGYMDPGDLFTERSSYGDVESIIMISNKMTMSF